MKKFIADIEVEPFEEFTVFIREGRFYRDDEFKKPLKEDSTDALVKRLHHYYQWCQKFERDFTFEVFHFSHDEVKKEHYEVGAPVPLLVRECTMERLHNGSAKVIFSASRRLEDGQFYRRLKLLDNVSDPVVVTEAEPFDDIGPRVLYANQAFTQLTGYSFLEVVGKNPRFLQGDQLKENEAAREKIKEGLKNWQSFTQEVKNYKKSGEAFVSQLKISPVADETGWWTHWVSFQRDITKERLAFAASEKIQDIGKIGYWSLNVKTGDVELSSMVYEIYGVKPGGIKFAEEGISFYAPHERARITKYVEECSVNKVAYDSVFEFYDKQGNKKWVRSSGAPLVESNGEVLEVFGTFQDVTEYIEKQKLLQAIVDNSPDIIYRLNEQGEFIFASNSWTSLLGHEPHEVVGKHFIPFVHPNDVERCGEELKKMITGEKDKTVVEYRVLHKEGHYRWHRTHGVVSREGEFYFQGIASDISELKEAISEKETLLAATNIGLWRWDIVTNELWWDDSMYQVFGVQKEHFSGAFNAWESTLHPDDKEKALSLLQESLADPQKIDFEMDFRIYSHERQVRYIHGRIVVERNSDGQAIRAKGINMDRTDEYLKEMEAEEEKKKSIVQSRLASLGELASGVGHEINNPLAIALGSIRQFKRKHQGVGEEYVSNIEDALKRISAITKGLKTLSRQETSKAPFSLKEAIEESIFFVKGVYRSHGVEVSFHNHLGHEEDPMVREPQKLQDVQDVLVYANRPEIQQIFMNLISNAFDATEGKDERFIEIHLKGNKQKAIVEVKDNGFGIAPENQERIFESFFTTKDVGKGVGIGLSICKSIAENNSAQLAFSSTPWEGTSFYLTLPVLESQRNEQINTTSTQKEKDKKKADKDKSKEREKGRVLIVDDEEGIRFLIENCLQEGGFECDCASNAKEAMDFIFEKKQHYDVVISDMRMPEVSGIELAKILNEKLEDLPEIFLITGGINEDEKALNELNFISGLLFKPFDEEEILAVLNSVMNQKQTEAH